MTRPKLVQEVPPTRDGCKCRDLPGFRPSLSPSLHKPLENALPRLAGLPLHPVDPKPAARSWDDDCRAADEGPDEYAKWIADLQDAS